MIISRNYREPMNVDERWLYRQDVSSVSSAVPATAIRAGAFKFKSSGEEVGWGCSLVAFAEQMEPIPDTEPPGDGWKPIYWDWSMQLFVDDDRREVIGGAGLLLRKDGSVYVSAPVYAS